MLTPRWRQTARVSTQLQGQTNTSRKTTASFRPVGAFQRLLLASTTFAAQAHTYTRIVDLQKNAKAGDKIEIKGWVRTVRHQKTNTFVEVNDGSSLANFQVVTTPDLVSNERILAGCSVAVEGTIAASPHGAAQKFELQPDQIKVLGLADETFPIAKKRHTLEFLREMAHLRPRTNTFGALLRVRNESTMAVHKFFQDEGFINIHTPIISSNDCEGAGDLFVINTKSNTEVDAANNKHKNLPPGYNHFFNCPEAFLTVSGQLDAEIFACSMGRVYTFGPTFRAENSNTPRHLSEFWMIEPEAAFFDLEAIMGLSERFVKSVVKQVSDRCVEDLQFFDKWVDTTLKKRLEATIAEPFARITYTDAAQLLQKNGFDFKWGDDLGREHEKFLCETHFQRPTFVTDWPKEIKAFYMKLNPDGKTVACMDLLAPRIGEIIGGSAREDEFGKLEGRMKELKMNLDANSWYLDLRKYGSVPHAGFGLGFERLLQFVTGLENIRDTVPIPRAKGYCKF